MPVILSETDTLVRVIFFIGLVHRSTPVELFWDDKELRCEM